MDTKICTSCGEDLSLDLFTKYKERYQSWCKKCTSAASKASYHKNREKHGRLTQEERNKHLAEKARKNHLRTHKVCSSCKEDKSIKNYRLVAEKRRKSPYYKSECNECEYKRNRIHLTKRFKTVKDFLVETVCIDCKESDWRVLEFDHIGVKKANISDLWRSKVSCTKEELLTEMKNCEVVCANCHRLRTYGRLENSFRTNL